MIAYKNDRQLWSTDLTYSTNCAAGWGTLYTGAPAFSSIGADGNLYLMMQPGFYPTSCPDRLIGINVVDGSVIFDDSLGAPPGTGLGYAPSAAHVWTYDDKIVVMDRNYKLREFSYAGVENTTGHYNYTFAPPTGHSVYSVVANSAGTVFAAAASGTPGYGSVIMYHKDNGDTGYVDTASDSFSHPKITATADGNVAAAFDTYVYRYDVAMNTYSTISLSAVSGYPHASLLSYVEDGSGNGLIVRNLLSSSYTSRAVSVDLIDASTQADTSLLFLDHTVDSGSNPSVSPYYNLADGIAAGYLYLPVCRGGWDCPGRSENPWVYKVALTGFGTPVRDDLKRNSYEKLNYVAMGDSYSSGEGVTPFFSDSDISSTDECHRSKLSYPTLLDQDATVKLNLSAFVACSGATTGSLLNGGSGHGAWDEPSQLSALSSSTNVITLSIGGNDAGFSTILRACIQSIAHSLPAGWGCSSNNDVVAPLELRMDALAGTSIGTEYTSESPSRQIYSIQDVLTYVMSAAPNSEIYISGYPHLFGSSSDDFESNVSAPGGAQCNVAWWSGEINVSYTDAQWINSQADDLNLIIQDAVDYANDHDGDVTYVPPTRFNTHGLCDSSTAYINPLSLTGDLEDPDVLPQSFHPTTTGVSDGYEYMFKSKINSHM